MLIKCMYRQPLECVDGALDILYVGKWHDLVYRTKIFEWASYVLVIIDYFTKWVEVASYTNVTR